MTSFSLLEDGITALKPPGSVTGLEEALGPVSSLPRGVSISLSFRADAVDKHLPARPLWTGNGEPQGYLLSRAPPRSSVSFLFII